MTDTAKSLAPWVLILGMLGGCAANPVVPGSTAGKAAPRDEVTLLNHEPRRPYIAIARIEVRGAANISLDTLLEEMRERARRLGADAVLPQERRHSSLGLEDNPWTGAYEKTPEGVVPVIYGYAIKYARKL